MAETIVISEPISKEALQILADLRFGDLVKGVIDLETKTVALGGELHADQEAILLTQGSHQENLWGFNIYVAESFPDNIEFDSMINIRPSQNNRSRFVEDSVIREKILQVLGPLLP